MKLRERSPSLWKQRGYIGIGNRRVMGSMNARRRLEALLDSSTFYAQLTHSLILQRGTGDPTFTRATTATFPDWEGILRTVPAGCARFVGARMVYNLWTTSSATLADTANKSLTLAAGDYVFSMGAGTGTATFSGTGGATGTLDATVVGRVSVLKTITAGTFVVTASVADLVDLQVENVTGQTTQTAGEYVSVGVLSAPYHGAGVDGVKYFDTDISGNPIASTTLLGYQAEGARTNLCLQSNAFTTTWSNATITPVQDTVGPDGATSAWSVTDDSAVAAESISQAITLTAATHAFSVFIKKTSGATTFPILQALTGTTFAGCTIDTNNGIATVWTSYTSFTIVTSSATCASFNADYWRVTLTFLASVASWTVSIWPAYTANASLANGATVSVAQTGTQVIYGAQVELGSFASSYIPTTTIAVARAADVLTYQSAGNVDGTKGWAYAEINIPSVAAFPTAIATYTGSGTNGNLMSFNNNASLTLNDGTATRVLSGPVATLNSVNKLSTSWGGTSAYGSIAGVVSSEAIFDGDLSVGANIGVGCYTNGTGNTFGTVRNVRIGQRALSSSELVAMTL